MIGLNSSLHRSNAEAVDKELALSKATENEEEIDIARKSRTTIPMPLLTRTFAVDVEEKSVPNEIFGEALLGAKERMMKTKK